MEQVRLLGTANQNIQVKDFNHGTFFLVKWRFQDNHIFIRVKSDKLLPLCKESIAGIVGETTP